jgi:putative protein kinase ArgK-like GTPase of G3E family
MELPDVLVVNKADHVELARRASAELKAALASLARAGIGSRTTPVALTSALEGTGVHDFVDAMLKGSARDDLLPRRRGGAIAWGVKAFMRRHGEVGVERVGGTDALEKAIAKRVDDGEEVLAIVDSL